MVKKDISETHIGDIELNHHLQRQILSQFLHSDQRTYTELLIDGMSGNSFLYHLKTLIRQKLISKTSPHSYELTALGKLVLDNLSFETHRFRLRPTSGVFLVARTKSGEYMLYKSARQPFIGRSGFVFGKSRVGQGYQEMIDRITSRRGITSYSVVDSRPISIIYRSGGEVVSHRIGLYIMIEVGSTIPERTTDAGMTHWTRLSEAKLLLPEVKMILDHTDDTAFIEIDTVV